MKCPNCGEEFVAASLQKDSYYTQKIKCPRCHELYKDPELNCCINMDLAGYCKKVSKDGYFEKCRGVLGFENCPSYIENSPASKPPLGCSPYYVNISARICELCEAIKRYSTVSDKHDKISLWCREIMYLNEVDRNLHYDERCKTWREDKKGHLHEMP